MAKLGTKRKPRATEEFKSEVAEAYRNRGTRSVNEIAEQFGVVNSQIHRWRKDFPATKSPSAARAKAGRDQSPPPLVTNGKTRAKPNYSEISQLQRENQMLHEEIEVLKKTIVVFARRD